MFCTQIQKFPYFEPTLDYVTLRNLGTVLPIFAKIASKVAQDSKEKNAKRRGGGDSTPPPPPRLD